MTFGMSRNVSIDRMAGVPNPLIYKLDTSICANSSPTSQSSESASKMQKRSQ
jgi:hypothetical protein